MVMPYVNMILTGTRGLMPVNTPMHVMTYVQKQMAKMQNPYGNYPFDLKTDTVGSAAGNGNQRGESIQQENLLGSDDAIGDDAIEEDDEDSW